MSPRLPSASTSRPGARACSTTSLRARAQPGAPRRSKQASCGLTATQAGPAASIAARQCAATAAAARSAGDPSAARRRLAPAATAARGRDRARGRSGTRARRRARRAGRRSADRPAPGGAACRRRSASVVDRLLQARAGGELRHLRRAIWIGSPVRGCTPSRSSRWATWNLPNPENVTSLPRFSVVLDRAEHGVDGLAGFASWPGPRDWRPDRRTRTSSRCAPPGEVVVVRRYQRPRTTFARDAAFLRRFPSYVGLRRPLDCDVSPDDGAAPAVLP